MVYRFHDDDHGEVLAEITKRGLDRYLGLCYPATDVPEAARFRFMKTKVRIICDCLAVPVKKLQLTLPSAVLPSEHHMVVTCNIRRT